jgi:hypothetical protein
MIRAAGFGGRARFVRAVLIGLALTLLPGAVRANTITIVGSVDATISDTNGDGIFDSTTAENPSTFGLVVRQFENFSSSISFEDRAVIEFSLAGIAPTDTITGLTFTFGESSATSNSGRIVGVYGFAGDGAISLADATAPATELASYDNWAIGLGAHTLTLDPSTLQSLLGHTSYFAIRLQGDQLSTNTSLNSLEENFGTPPQITVTTAAPLPSPLRLLAGLGILVACGQWWSRRRAGIRTL